MGLGIREPSPSQHVPGTVTLYESGLLAPGSAVESGTSGITSGRKRDEGIVLVPQPSDSVNDPLNWPLWKKDLTLFTICFTTAVGGIVGPALAPVNGVLVEEFNTTYTVVANFSGYQFFASGAAGLLCEVMARLWGKRPIYFLSTAFLLAGTVWNAMVKSGDVGGFMGARVLQGVGLGAFETLVVSSIGDIYFVHQRGKRIAFYNLLFLGTTYFMPVIAGYISVKHGWRMQFKIISGFLGVALLMVFFFCPEHAFVRGRKFETDFGSGDSSSTSVVERPESVKVGEGEAKATGQSTSVVGIKKTFLQELRLYNGRFSTDGFWKLLFAPFPCMLYPATIWAFLFQGTFVTWGIGVSVVLAQIFSAPPFEFDSEQMGYIYAAPTIGAILAYILSNFASDSICLFLSRRNNLVYEPEFRIFLVIPVLLTGVPGLIAYGYATTTPGIHWIVPSVLYGMLTFAVILSCVATYAYVLDAHREISVEMMVAVLILKNFFAWGSTFYISNWIVDWGAVRVFQTMGILQAVICVCSLLVYVYGKIWRAKMERLQLLARLGLKPGKMRE
ncbi:major facilitator superfamily domain-containing protein [Kalaharituber pfeilii]|nr:major facilitator superfamily domain-containing protein [Kalaharituber pfeilii]